MTKITVLSQARQDELAAHKWLGLPTEVFVFTRTDGTQDLLECRGDGDAISTCEESPDVAFVADLDGNVIGGTYREFALTD